MNLFKHCWCCNTGKPYTDFGKDKHRKDGLTYICKACSAEKRRKFYLRHAERIKSQRAAKMQEIKADPVAYGDFIYNRKIKRYANEDRTRNRI